MSAEDLAHLIELQSKRHLRWQHRLNWGMLGVLLVDAALWALIIMAGVWAVRWLSR